MGPVTCHAVGAVDGAQSDGVGIGSEVTHDPNTADVRQAGKVPVSYTHLDVYKRQLRPVSVPFRHVPAGKLPLIFCPLVLGQRPF